MMSVDFEKYVVYGILLILSPIVLPLLLFGWASAPMWRRLGL